MSELKNNQRVNEEPVGESSEVTAETDPFASLNRMLEENPQLKSTFDSVMSILVDESTDEEGTEVECVEINGHDYIVVKKIETAGNTYLCLVNDDDIMDFIFQKVTIEDGEAYITGLDSEKEFDLVQAYIQRDFLIQLKGKLKSNSEDKPDNQ